MDRSPAHPARVLPGADGPGLPGGSGGGSPALTATCEARPSAGTAPLGVAFLLNVAGAEGPVTFSISYGDGQSGTNPDAAHTYAAPGSYTAAFDVRTSTQSARCSTTVSVSPGTTPVSANQPPKAVFRTNPAPVGGAITGTAPFTVHFDMCPTSDPENDELYFGMDFEGDDKFDFKGITGFHCRADHVYAAGRGGRSSASTTSTRTARRCTTTSATRTRWW